MPLDVAIVGAGKIGRKHARVLNAFPDASVSHVVDADGDAAADLASVVDAAACDLEVGFEDADAAYVCTPDDTHAEIARRAIEVGLHSFVEKPLATTVEAADELATLAAESGGVHAVGHLLRFDDRYRLLRRDLGRVGEPVSAVVERLVPRSRVRRRGSSTRPAMSLGVHDFDLLCWLLDRDVERVRARSSDGALRTEGYGVEDVTSVVCEFEGGATATLVLGFCLPDGHPGSVARTRVVGEDGVASVDAGPGDVRRWDGEGGAFPDAHLWPDAGDVPGGALAAEDRAFVDAVVAGGSSPVPFADGRRAVAIARAAERAADGGGPTIVE